MAELARARATNPSEAESGVVAELRRVGAAGLAFLVTGTAALLAGPSWGDFFLAAGFGGINLAGGVVFLRRHGG